MKTILEIFYLRLMGDRVWYQRKEVNLSRKGSDPDSLIWSQSERVIPTSHALFRSCNLHYNLLLPLVIASEWRPSVTTEATPA